MDQADGGSGVLCWLSGLQLQLQADTCASDPRAGSWCMKVAYDAQRARTSFIPRFTAKAALGCSTRFVTVDGVSVRLSGVDPGVSGLERIQILRL
jgi:hypothetical protein